MERGQTEGTAPGSDVGDAGAQADRSKELSEPKWLLCAFALARSTTCQARRRDLLLNANIDAMNAAARSTISAIDMTADELAALPPAEADDLAAAFEAAH